MLERAFELDSETAVKRGTATAAKLYTEAAEAGDAIVDNQLGYAIDRELDVARRRRGFNHFGRGFR